MVDELATIEMLRLAVWALADFAFVLGLLWGVRALLRAKCVDVAARPGGGSPRASADQASSHDY